MSETSRRSEAAFFAISLADFLTASLELDVVLAFFADEARALVLGPASEDLRFLLVVLDAGLLATLS